MNKLEKMLAAGIISGSMVVSSPSQGYTISSTYSNPFASSAQNEQVVDSEPVFLASAEENSSSYDKPVKVPDTSKEPVQPTNIGPVEKYLDKYNITCPSGNKVSSDIAEFVTKTPDNVIDRLNDKVRSICDLDANKTYSAKINQEQVSFSNGFNPSSSELKKELRNGSQGDTHNVSITQVPTQVVEESQLESFPSVKGIDISSGASKYALTPRNYYGVGDDNVVISYSPESSESSKVTYLDTETQSLKFLEENLGTNAYENPQTIVYDQLTGIMEKPHSAPFVKVMAVDIANKQGIQTDRDFFKVLHSNSEYTTSLEELIQESCEVNGKKIDVCMTPQEYAYGHFTNELINYATSEAIDKAVNEKKIDLSSFTKLGNETFFTKYIENKAGGVFSWLVPLNTYNSYSTSHTGFSSDVPSYVKGQVEDCGTKNTSSEIYSCAVDLAKDVYQGTTQKPESSSFMDKFSLGDFNVTVDKTQNNILGGDY